MSMSMKIEPVGNHVMLGYWEKHHPVAFPSLDHRALWKSRDCYQLDQSQGSKGSLPSGFEIFSVIPASQNAPVHHRFYGFCNHHSRPYTIQLWLDDLLVHEMFLSRVGRPYR